jgi:phosphate transport system permease protein
VSDAAWQRLPNLARRHRKAALARRGFALLTWLGVALLAVLLARVARQGFAWMDWEFLTSFPSRFPERAGVLSALAGTLWLIGLTALFSVPIGIAAAIYLEEFSRPGRLRSVIEVNIANLAGVPSIVYGLNLGRSVLAGALTMSLLILPTIIIAAREALKAVPQSLRQGAMALGATQWQAVRHHALPSALPGILTGIILSLSRAIGEAAPLIMIGALTYIAFTPDGPMDDFTALPIQIYNWASRPQKDFHGLAAGGIIVLLAVLLLMNAAAVAIRYRSQRKS